MNDEENKLALYEKLRIEQDDYKKWLLSQAPRQILDHTNEYSIREEILTIVREGNISPTFAKALLYAEHPLATMYSDWSKCEYNKRDELFAIVNSRAESELYQSDKFMEICIYQIDHVRDRNRVAFLSSSELRRVQGSNQVMSSIYNGVFRDFVESPTLEGIYYKFNVDHPEGFTGHSLSVSDVVQVIRSRTVEPGFYFCEKFGFTKIDFEPEKTKDMTNMIPVLLLEIGKTARPILIKNNTEAMRQIVGGPTASARLPDGCLLMVREGATLTTMPANRVIRKNGKITDVVVGTCFICGTKDGHYAGLNREQMEHYKKEFMYPQKVTHFNREYYARDIKSHDMER